VNPRRFALALAVGAAMVSLGAQRVPGPEALRTAILDAEDARAPTSEPLEVLKRGLASASAEERRQAVRALGRLERPSIFPIILPVLADPVIFVRAEAADAVAQAVNCGDDREAISGAQRALLTRAETESDGLVRGALAEAIGRLRYVEADAIRAAEAALIRLSFAPTAPGGTPDQRSVDASPLTLLGVARGLESIARRHGRMPGLAGETIGRMRDLGGLGLAPSSSDAASAAPSPVAAARVRRLMVAGLVAGGALDERTRRRAMQDPDPEVRRQVVIALADQQVVEPREVDALAKDPSPLVRHEVVRRLGAQGAVARRLANESNDHVAGAAISAVGLETGEGRADAVAQLQPFLAKPPAADPRARDWHRYARALSSLSRLAPDDARPHVQRAARHPNSHVRAAAGLAASAIDRPTARVLAGDRDHNVAHAVVSVGRDRPHDYDPLYLAALERRDYQLVMAAALGLEGTDRTREAVDALAVALSRITAERRESSRDVRRALVQRLGDLGDARDAKALRALLTDFDPEIAREAASVLEAWTGKAERPAPKPLSRAPVPTPDKLAELQRLRAVVKMATGGEFTLSFLVDDAPLNIARFVRLARARYYDGLTFHRVEPGFVVQGGSPGANEYAGDGPYTRDEIGRASHVRGSVGVSTRGRDTGDGQFFINLVDNPRLDHEYTVFAQVVSGMEIVDRILEGDLIASVTIVPASAR
jgi:cyclophilin family peptidyl-prolyl cis-trans isomerase/HEAT repeat protein